MAKINFKYLIKIAILTAIICLYNAKLTYASHIPEHQVCIEYLDSRLVVHPLVYQLAALHFSAIRMHDQDPVTSKNLLVLFEKSLKELSPDIEITLIDTVKNQISIIVQQLQHGGMRVVHQQGYGSFIEVDRAKEMLSNAVKLIKLQAETNKSFEDIAVEAIDVNKVSIIQGLIDYRDIRSILFMKNIPYQMQNEMMSLLSQFNLSKDDFQKNWDINYQNNHLKISLLHKAVMRKREKIALMLIRSQININMQDASGYTPLHSAFYLRMKAVIEALLNAGANLELEGIEVNTNSVSTPLHYASVWLAPALLKEVFQEYHLNPNTVSSDGESLLMFAARSSDKVINKTSNIDALIKVGANIHYRHPVTERSVLHYALQFDHSEQHSVVAMLQTLLNHGAQINSVDKENTTAFIAALELGQIYVAKFLLNIGADPSILPTRKLFPNKINNIKEVKKFLRKAIKMKRNT